VRRLLAAAALLSCSAAAAQVDEDPEMLEGIRLVAEGDFDAAVVKLDAVVRRLTGDPRRSEELVRAHVHLGAAYLGLDKPASARARFRDALALNPRLQLRDDEFPRGVIRAFEAARQETGAAATAAGGAAPEVTVSGKVKRPGAYPFREGMTVADVLSLSGAKHGPGAVLMGDKTIKWGRMRIALLRGPEGQRKEIPASPDDPLQPGDALVVR
jgi:hypothetical protein